ncbi:hypothetical protein [Phreatobacter sp. AB_2022a]|uniref:hypothetical protein n=1 Tax=Phreatobacter sp. AB_2022a TaxID=3003134 RepID=UPI002286F2FD|nr:hypothetical protein [Phreatobacter sp. AB_2022a]MCZ0734571.1 hypothetical protein [Phreatobacter sp. AB_2022a]
MSNITATTTAADTPIVVESFNWEIFGDALFAAHRAAKLSALMASLVARNEAPPESAEKAATAVEVAFKRLTAVVYGEQEAKQVTLTFQ